MADLKNSTFKNTPKLSDGFLSATQSGAEQRIAGVAADHDYTVIADMSHASASAYRVLSRETGMAALEAAGVKHIAVEMLDPGQNIIIDAYRRGEISDRTLRHNYVDLSVSSMKGDLGVDGGETQTAMADMIQAAKRHGIAVHGVNALEGMYEPKDILPFMADNGRLRLDILKDIDASPDYYAMDKNGQKNFIVQSLEQKGLRTGEIQMQLDNMGFNGDFAKQAFFKNMPRSSWIERFNRDDVVAERIIAQTNGEKTVVVYGGAHVLRSHGDLDNLLPNSASIEVFDDKKSYEKNILPKVEKEARSMGFDLKDRGDYSLDFKTGVWTGPSGGQTHLGGDIPIPAERPPSPQEQKVLDSIKF